LQVSLRLLSYLVVFCFVVDRYYACYVLIHTYLVVLRASSRAPFNGHRQSHLSTFVP
jgi:hypothetical protein